VLRNFESIFERAAAGDERSKQDFKSYWARRRAAGEIIAGGSANASVTPRAIAAPASIPAPRITAGTPRSLIISFTFDDGRASQYNAAPLLAARGMTGTFYVNSGRIGTSDYYMTWAQLHDTANAGHEIGGHTVDHPYLSILSSASATTEIARDRSNIETQGFTVKSFAYPFGDFQAREMNIAYKAGYANARAFGGGPDDAENPLDGPFALRSYNICGAYNDLATLQQWVNEAKATPGSPWLIFTIHDVIPGGDPTALAMDTTVFTNLLDWIESQPEIEVKTVGQVISASQAPANATQSYRLYWARLPLWLRPCSVLWRLTGRRGRSRPIAPNISGSFYSSDTGAGSYGIEFQATQPGCYLTGYHWYWPVSADPVPAGDIGDAGPKTFALYTVNGDGTCTLVAGSQATSVAGSRATSCDQFVAGSWNRIRIHVRNPIPLVQGQKYRVGVYGSGGSTWHEDTTGYFSPGAYVQNSITSGPIRVPNNVNPTEDQGSYHLGTGIAYAAPSGNGSEYGIDLEISRLS